MSKWKYARVSPVVIERLGGGLERMMPKAADGSYWLWVTYLHGPAGGRNDSALEAWARRTGSLLYTEYQHLQARRGVTPLAALPKAEDAEYAWSAATEDEADGPLPSPAEDDDKGEEKPGEEEI